MELNQKLFDGTELRANVRDKLLQDANKFIDFLHDPDINVQDIIFTGSNASYNFTPTSDVDVHILADFTTLPFSSIADSYFLAEKALRQQLKTEDESAATAETADATPLKIVKPGRFAGRR